MESSHIDLPRESKLGCPRKSYLSRIHSASLSESDTTGLDILANIASPKNEILANVSSPRRQRVHVDSFSNVSLPDEMRISFSESEFQLDDCDFSYSPAADVDLSNANIVSVDSNSDLSGDKDLQSFQASISSTSGYDKSDSNTKNNVDSSRTDISFDSTDIKKGENTSFHNLVASKYKFSHEDENQTKEVGEKLRTDSEITWNENVQVQEVSTVGSSVEILDKKLVSPRRRNKPKHITNIACQVCGDMAAGFYCGAYICEACKKFYMRAYKLDKMKYVCLRDKNCIITKESRVQCQYCRYQKCVRLNMYCLNKGEAETNKDGLMSEIPCRVCAAPSSGFHFGAITCEGCKGFFRRMAKEREPEKYQCTKKGNCEINMLTRNLCKACRYTQCLTAGMSVEGSRIGRQPNSVKHLISMEVKGHVKIEPDADSLGDLGEMPGKYEPHVRIKEEPVDFMDDSCEKLNSHPILRELNDSDRSLLGSGDVIIVDEPHQKSASAAKPAQQNLALNTSTCETVQPLFLSNIECEQVSKELSPLLPIAGQKLSKRSSDLFSSYIPAVNGSSHLKTVKHEEPPLSGPIHKSSLSGQSQAGNQPGLTRLVVSRSEAGDWSAQQHPSYDPLTSGQKTGTKCGTSHSVSNSPNSSPSYNQRSTIPWQSAEQSDRRNLEAFNLKTEVQQNIAFRKTRFHSNGDYMPLQNARNRHVSAEEPRREVQQYQSNNYVQENKERNYESSGPTCPKKMKQQQQMQNSKTDARSHVQPMFYLSTAEGDQNYDGVDELEGLHLSMSMPDFICSVIEAGKCLQLLNYRVFDTDLNPTSSLNVDEIKNVFKLKNVDPKVGNKITSSVNMSMFASKESTWRYMMTNFHHNTYITIRFAKMVPGFKTLSLNDQVKLIQTSIYPIELLNMSKVYDPVTKQYNYFTYTKEEEDIMMEHFPMLRVFQEHFLHVGEMVTTFSLTDEEFALLSALLLFPAEISGLENPKAVEELQNKVTAALQYYEEKRSPSDGLTRFGILLVRVAELIQCLLQHNLAIGLLLTHNPSIKVPQLFHELIIESIKEGQR